MTQFDLVYSAFIRAICVRLAFSLFRSLRQLPQSRIVSFSELETRNSKPETENRVFELLAAQGSPLTDTDPLYSYDLNGNRASMIDPTGLTTYTYDALNRLTSITNNNGIVTSFTYDALGRRKTLTHGNGVVTSYTYDAASQLLSLAHKLGATTINSFRKLPRQEDSSKVELLAFKSFSRYSAGVR